MKIKQTLLGAIATIGLIGVGMSSAYANTINFDQREQGASGTFEYADGGPLVGNDITFSFVSSPSASTVTCSNCLLNFTTGNLDSKNGTLYSFNGGGTFQLTGEVLDGSGGTIASGTLLDGQFLSNQTFIKQGTKSGTFAGNGTNIVDDALAAYFGIAPGSDFMFLTTNFSIGELTYGAGGSFNGDVTAADLATTNVPEPQELGIFGLGLALMMFGLAYRRKNGSNLG